MGRLVIMNQSKWISKSDSSRVAQTEPQLPGRDSILAEIQPFKGKDPCDSLSHLNNSFVHYVKQSQRLEAEMGWVLTQKLHIPQSSKSTSLPASLLLLLLLLFLSLWVFVFYIFNSEWRQIHNDHIISCNLPVTEYFGILIRNFKLNCCDRWLHLSTVSMETLYTVSI